MMIFGFDPGGKSGVALLTESQMGYFSGEVATLRSVADAYDWLSARASMTLEAAGIDSLISWSLKRAGWRPMDLYLREKYPKIENSVVSSNSLYGAMGVQGMAMAILLRKRWPSIILNETHPKVQYFAASGIRHRFGKQIIGWLEKQVRWNHFPEISTEDEWDALYSALFTHQALSSDERIDLIEATQAKESLLFPAGQSNYFWL
jgi:hypothetical protein